MTTVNQDQDIQPRKHPNRLRQWTFRLTGCAGGILIAALILEVTLRIFSIQPQYNIVHKNMFRLVDDPELGYELIPNAPDKRDTISSAGLRDREFDQQKPPDVFRIAVIGDSVTFGLHSPQNDSYPKSLESMLNACKPPDSPKFEVMNFGVPGYSAVQIARQLKTRVLAFQPDLVIYGYVLNDPQPASIEQQLLDAFNDAARYGQYDSILRPVNELLHNSRLFRILRFSIVGIPEHINKRISDPGYVAVAQGKHAEFIRSLHQGSLWKDVQDSMRSIGGHDVPILLALFPTRKCVSNKQYQALAEVRSLILSEASKHDMQTLDLLQPYLQTFDNGSGRLFFDLLHPNQTGNRVAAAAILTNLVMHGGDNFAEINLDCVTGGDELLNAAVQAVRSSRDEP